MTHMLHTGQEAHEPKGAGTAEKREVEGPEGTRDGCKRTDTAAVTTVTNTAAETTVSTTKTTAASDTAEASISTTA